MAAMQITEKAVRHLRNLPQIRPIACPLPIQLLGQRRLPVATIAMVLSCFDPHFGMSRSRCPPQLPIESLVIWPII